MVGDLPNAKTFQSGDFIWPKTKGAFVPRVRSVKAPSKEQIAWDAERDQLLAQDPATSGLSPEAAKKLKAMTYEDYEKLYFVGPAEAARTRGVTIAGHTVFVGHVAIIEIDEQGNPFVIEATPTAGLKGAVVRIAYAEWLDGKHGMQVWHGRMRDLRPSVRKRIVTEAIKQVGKPYAFFNFDLNDDGGFYCSKLAWMCVWRATPGVLRKAIAVDDDPNPHRSFLSWFTPKQMINAQRIELLHKPGEY